MKKIKCKFCHKEFLIPNWKNSKYCNYECYNKDRKKFFVKCAKCHKKIKIIGSRYKKSKTKVFYCSLKCKYSESFGKNNPNYGNHKLASINNPNYKGGKFINCLNCGNPIWVIPCKRKSKKFCSWKCKIGYEIGNRGAGFINGKSKEPYPLEWTDKLKYIVRNRDNNKCVVCSMTNKQHLNKFKYNLVVHHIDYNKQNCKLDNLVTLCHICHNATNRNRKKWEHYFNKRRK